MQGMGSGFAILFSLSAHNKRLDPSFLRCESCTIASTACCSCGSVNLNSCATRAGLERFVAPGEAQIGKTTCSCKESTATTQAWHFSGLARWYDDSTGALLPNTFAGTVPVKAPISERNPKVIFPFTSFSPPPPAWKDFSGPKREWRS